jgi:hypothetical protein
VRIALNLKAPGRSRETQVRTGLFPGERWIRTFGPPQIRSRIRAPRSFSHSVFRRFAGAAEPGAGPRFDCGNHAVRETGVRLGPWLQAAEVGMAAAAAGLRDVCDQQ